MHVHVTPAARLDIIEAFDWYEARAAGLGARFVSETDRQIARLTALQFPVIAEDIRRADCGNFPTPYSSVSKPKMPSSLPAFMPAAVRGAGKAEPNGNEL